MNEDIKLLAEDCTPIHDERIKQIPNIYADKMLEDVIYHIDGEIILNAAKELLSERSYEILLKRYGFYDGCEWSYEMIGKELHISKERVIHIISKSLKSLRLYVMYQERRKYD